MVLGINTYLEDLDFRIRIIIENVKLYVTLVVCGGDATFSKNQAGPIGGVSKFSPRLIFHLVL